MYSNCNDLSLSIKDSLVSVYTLSIGILSHTDNLCHMKNRWYIGEGYNGGLTTLEACVILGTIIYIIIEVVKWIRYLM